ncbi:tetratricopeptide repeat protein [Caldicellulosiruptoraceae bacterium PP1]
MNKGKVVNLSPSPKRYFKLGLKLYEKGDIEQAIEKLKKAYDLDKDDVEIKFNLAGLLAQKGEFNESNKILFELIDKVPNFSESLFGLGCNFFEMGKHNKAKMFLRRFLVENSESEFIYAAEELIDYIESQEEFLREQKRIDKISKLLEKGNKALENSNFEEAVKYFKLILSIDDTIMPAKNNLSLAYFYLGFVDKAIKIATDIIEEDNFNTYANCNLAVFYKFIGYDSLFQNQFIKISRLKPIDIKDKVKLLDTFIKLNKHEFVTKKSHELFELTGDPFFLHLLAISLFNQRKIFKAQKLWSKIKKENLLNDININYFITKIKYTLLSFKFEEIDYYETGFKNTDELPPDIKLKVEKEVKQIVKELNENRYQKSINILNESYNLNDNDYDQIINIIKSFPSNYSGLKAKGFVAAILYLYFNEIRNIEFPKDKIADLFNIKIATLDKWVREIRDIIIKKDIY